MNKSWELCCCRVPPYPHLGTLLMRAALGTFDQAPPFGFFSMQWSLSLPDAVILISLLWKSGLPPNLNLILFFTRYIWEGLSNSVPGRPRTPPHDLVPSFNDIRVDQVSDWWMENNERVATNFLKGSNIHSLLIQSSAWLRISLHREFYGLRTGSAFPPGQV